MGQYNVKPTGTKTTGFSADWTDAECYPTLQEAINRGITSSDVITLDDTTHDIGSTNWGTSNAADGVHFVINSRSGNRDTCILDATSTSQSGMRLGRSGRNFTFEFSNIGLKKSVTHTISNAVFVHFEHTSALDCEFVGCRFFDTTVNYPATGATGYFRIPTGATRQLRFTNCLFDNLVSSHTGGRYFAFPSAGATLWFDGCTFSNITHNWTENSEALGGVNGDGIVKITNCTFSNITQNHAAGATLPHNSFISAEGHLEVDGATATNMVLTNGTAGAVLLRAQSTYNIRNVLGEDCVSTPTAGVNSVGGLVLAMGEAAQGVTENIMARRCTADHGTALYCSQGAGGTHRNIRSEYCTARSIGIVYFGGWGDNHLDGFAIIGCRIGEFILFSNTAGSLYAHVHPSSPRSKSTSFKNGYLRGGRQLQGVEPGISVYNTNGSVSHNVEIENVVIDNPGSKYQLRVVTTPAGVINLTGSGITVDGGSDTLDLREDQGSGVRQLSFINARPSVRIGVAGNNAVRAA